MIRVLYKSTKIKFEEFSFIYDTAKGQIPIIPRIGEKIILKPDGSFIGTVVQVMYDFIPNKKKYDGSKEVTIWLS